MPKGYVIAHSVVTNPEKWAEYAAKTKVALDKFEGRPIARGGKSEIIEGSGSPRNVILEFPSYEHAWGYATSAEYAEAKALRQGAGTMNMTIVEGV
jgi:uncharacterized protein (DUF1330 family)